MPAKATIDIDGSEAVSKVLLELLNTHSPDCLKNSVFCSPRSLKAQVLAFFRPPAQSCRVTRRT